MVLVTHLSCKTSEAQTPDATSRIVAAALPLPEHLRADATVIATADDGTTTTLKKGSNGMVCTNASTPDTFSAFCFNESVFALLNRATELSKQLGSPDTSKPVTDTMEKEIKAGKLYLPPQTTVGFAMRGPIIGYNPASNTTTTEIKSWQMIVVPYATGKTLGLPEQPSKGLPWVMAAGTWMAHIMIEH
jgi:hypothetical protein